MTTTEHPTAHSAPAASPALATDDLLAAARGIQDDVVAIRRRIHRHPEIGTILPVTQAVILEELATLGVAGVVHRSGPQ
jgi:hippurate hydrolase